jgi:hypothetical protein
MTSGTDAALQDVLVFTITLIKTDFLNAYKDTSAFLHKARL